MDNHRLTTCPKCRAKNIPVYQLGVPTIYEGHVIGALYLAAHACPKGGDHMRLQRQIDVDKLKARLRDG